MWCPEMSGIGFPSLCSRKMCVLWVLYCFCGWGKDILCFYIFGWFKAWCNMPNNSRMYFDHYFWALGQCPNIIASCSAMHKLEIHSGPNLLGNYKAYISSVFKRYRFCSSTVLVCAFNLFVCLIWGTFTVHIITISNNRL